MPQKAKHPYASLETQTGLLYDPDFWTAYAARYNLSYITYSPGLCVQLAIHDTTGASAFFRALYNFFYLSQERGVDYTLSDTFSGQGGRFIVVRKTGLWEQDTLTDEIPIVVENSVETWYQFAQHFDLHTEELGLQTTKYFHLTPTTTAENLFDALYLLEYFSKEWCLDFELLIESNKRTIMVV